MKFEDGLNVVVTSKPGSVSTGRVISRSESNGSMKFVENPHLS